MAKEIETVKELRAAVKQAKEILVGVRFGVSEKYVKISKKEAMYLIGDISADVSPRDFEMYGGVFAEIDAEGTLTLG